MTRTEYIERLQDLISNLESEVRIFNQWNLQEISEDTFKSSLAYALDCSYIEVNEDDINLLPL